MSPGRRVFWGSPLAFIAAFSIVPGRTMTLIIEVGFWSIIILSMAGWWLEALATNFPDTSSILCKKVTIFLKDNSIITL